MTVEVNEAQRTFNAKSEDGAGIATGDFIEVVDIIGEVLVVKRIYSRKIILLTDYTVAAGKHS